MIPKALRSAKARRRAALGALAALAAWLVTTLAWRALVPALPDVLRDPGAYASVRFTDRDGATLRQNRGGRGEHARWVPLEEMPPALLQAIVASEDHHFLLHHGVDDVGVLRAMLLDLRAGRVVSGASTIPMQLARLAYDLPRTPAGKLEQAALAVWLDLHMSKHDMLEAYLNLAPFGHEVIGVGEAARAFIGKPVAHLTVGECGALASLPRSPRRYDPYRFEARLRARRAHVLALASRRFGLSDEARARGTREVLHLRPLDRTYLVPHFVQVAEAEARRAGLLDGAAIVETTIDPAIQAAAQEACARVPGVFTERHVTSCAAVVLRASTGEILALVGSAAWDDARHDGQVNGALARRQPGSALKPFVYGLAFEQGLTAASVLEDVETHFWTPQGDFVPRNYDDRFHGPVRAREALASSYNIPAVALAARLGPEAVLDRLRVLGLATLDQPADHYGVGLALGDGEVRLLDLAGAYATLARGGTRLDPTALRRVVRPDGRVVPVARDAPRRVMPAPVAWLLGDVLADDDARLGAFGEDSALELPFPASAKTGTSKGYRDNWTLGFAGDLVVGVWVGNFDGSPMRGVSGVTGAAPVFATVLAAALGADAPRSPPAPPDGIVEHRVCPLTGARPGLACPHSIRERFVAGTEPTTTCTRHELVAIDRRNGLRAGPGCDPRHVAMASFASVPPRLERWAAGRDGRRAPDRYSALCPGPAAVPGIASAGSRAGASSAASEVDLLFPIHGDRFALDPARPAGSQAISLRARVRGATRVTFEVDGHRVAESAAPFETTWLPTPGQHRITARTATASSSVEIEVAAL
jgi:penicillin-binding protein 1C